MSLAIGRGIASDVRVDRLEHLGIDVGVQQGFIHRD